jgi:CheY-like chemotaxis protein
VKVLIAEDDALSARILELTLDKWGLEHETHVDGASALAALRRPGAPGIALLDWMMPEKDGPAVCRELRRDEAQGGLPVYVILLTARSAKEDIVQGLQAGANDYLSKPFDREELRARIAVGKRVVELQRSLADRIRELDHALSKVKRLQGLLPICSYCKKIRGEKSYWRQVESYVEEHTDAQFTHSICPDCATAHVPPEVAERLARKRAAAQGTTLPRA